MEWNLSEFFVFYLFTQLVVAPFRVAHLTVAHFTLAPPLTVDLWLRLFTKDGLHGLIVWLIEATFGWKSIVTDPLSEWGLKLPLKLIKIFDEASLWQILKFGRLRHDLCNAENFWLFFMIIVQTFDQGWVRHPWGSIYRQLKVLHTSNAVSMCQLPQLMLNLVTLTLRMIVGLIELFSTGWVVSSFLADY